MLYQELSYNIRGAIYEVSHHMGAGLLEKCYQEALAIELQLRGIPFEREKRISVFYKGQKLQTDYIADFIVDGKIVLELKSIDAISDNHKAQLLNYLRLTGCELGFIVNFKNRKAEIERMVNRKDYDQGDDTILCSKHRRTLPEE